MRRALAATLLLLLAPGVARAAGPEIHVIALIDVMRGNTAAALPLLVARVRAERGAPGVVHVGLLQEDAAANHFILSETLRDRAAYDAQTASAAERRFRAALYPLLGSPYDERLTTEVTSSASSG